MYLLNRQKEGTPSELLRKAAKKYWVVFLFEIIFEYKLFRKIISYVVCVCTLVQL
jgi:hypothetical protein